MLPEEIDVGGGIREIITEKFPDGNVYMGATAQYKELVNPNGKILNTEFSYIKPENYFKQFYMHPGILHGNGDIPMYG